MTQNYTSRNGIFAYLASFVWFLPYGHHLNKIKIPGTALDNYFVDVIQLPVVEIDEEKIGEELVNKEFVQVQDETSSELSIDEVAEIIDQNKNKIKDKSKIKLFAITWAAERCPTSLIILDYLTSVIILNVIIIDLTPIIVRIVSIRKIK